MQWNALSGPRRMATIAAVLVFLAMGTGAHAVVIAKDCFESYEPRTATNLVIDGGEGWAEDTTSYLTDPIPGLSGSGQALYNPRYDRLLDLSSSTLDPWVRVDSSGDRVIGGDGVVVWTSFYIRVSPYPGSGRNGILGFHWAGNWRTWFQVWFFGNELNVNGTQFDGTDISVTTHVVARWEYTADRAGSIEVWLDPAATTEAGLGPAHHVTQPGFMESFNQINFATGGQGGATMEVDDFILATSYEELVGACVGDSDGDGVPDDADICDGGDDNVDTDGDNVPDFCDICPVDATNDSDGDGSCDSVDLCVGDDATGDGDADGLCNDGDPCVGASNADADNDGVCDEGDLCFGDDATGNTDGDGVCDDLDACEGDDATGDTDADGFCNDLDACPLDAENDADMDGFCESDDNCPLTANSSQSDNDDDGQGDVCDSDDDNDGVTDDEDNCPLDANSGQSDFDGDGAGDACDLDDDGDGVGDDTDACPATGPGEVVAVEGADQGCSIADLCPCDADWKNHGAYVRCVAHTSGAFVDVGLITEAEKDVIVSEAGQSGCGHKN